MGVPMSKSDHSGSEIDGGRLYEKCPEDEELKSKNRITSKAHASKKHALQPNIGKEGSKKGSKGNPVLSTIDDESFEEFECNDIQQRLKPSKANDLHIANTRFSGQGPTKSTTGPVFTSSVTQRSTRINSANFSPHSVSFDSDLNHFKLTKTPSITLSEEAMADERPAAPIPPILSDDIDNDTAINAEASGYLSDARELESKYTNQRDIEVPLSSKETKKGRSSSLLSVPEDSRNVHSPIPIPGQPEDDSIDLDPFEGMDIPRERVCSFGSSSIYSVKEISDRLYQEYFYEVRNSIRNYGFFEKFPTPSVVSDAQRTYRQMEIPTPADEEGNILPHPPKITKEDVFASQTKSFTEIDERIINAPEKILMSSETADIVNYLCLGLDDDLSKIRAISTWVAIRQMQTLDSGADHYASAEDWCRKFRAMCRYSRIKTKLVKGLVRGPTYLPGGNLEKGVWISVLVNNTWWLVDPIIHKETPDKLKSVHNGYINAEEQSSLFCHAEAFFWNPEQFIFTHFPDEEYWQLLARPVSRQEFNELAVLSRGFFSLRMKLISPNKSLIVVKKDQTIVSLGYPDNSVRQFQCNLMKCEDGSLTDSVMSQKGTQTYLRRFVFLETRLDKHRVNAIIKLPLKGTYIFELYGSSETQPWQKVCSYQLLNDREHNSVHYPVNTREEWGPGFDTLRLGLMPISHKGGEIVISGGVVQVAFKDPKRLQFRHDLLRDDGYVLSNSDITKVSVLRDGENDIVFVIDIDEKVIGTFVLQLNAKAGNNKTFCNFCNYLIRKVKAEKKPVIPRYSFNHVEVQQEKRLTHAPETGQLQLVVDASGISQLVVDLKLHDRQEINFSEHARHWIEDDQGFVDLNFPRKGQYSVKIIGRNIATNHFQTLREENIKADVPSEKWSAFPKTESAWSSFYKIEQPLAHHLPEKEYVPFAVLIKEAQDVAVLAPNGWYHLVRQDDGKWDGQIWTGPKSTKCRLLARFEIGSEKFTDLLWFKVMAEDDFDSMEDRQETQREQALKNLVAKH